MAALKYIFAALLIAAVWATVVLLELPMWIAIVATVVIVVVLATYVIIKVVRAKKAAREIERALKAQADRHAQSARPDLRADIDAMQQEFLKAIAALKTSKLGGKKPSEALYALPWYMIIGPPGAGKSTALRNSGLRFPYLSKSGGGVQGVGGTRNCQWWMTNEAVILDTAGRYTTEDSDRDEWLSFLDLLKRNRPKQPVNGVMVAISVADVSEAHPEDIHTRAREIRSRIDEVMAKLEMVVPVYVLFTKLDLLPGFVELFGDLGNTERRQIWGFTLPVTVKQDPTQSFAQNFDELASTIERRAVRRMGEERRVEARDKIYEFPQYFEPMKEKLALFVGELMADNVYAESPHLRGVYFTSGTQEGRTIDRIMNSMAAAFGIQPKLAYTTPQIEPKSYFLGELFEKVIFPDKLIAARSATKIKKQALIGHGIGAGLLLTAFGMAVLPVTGFRNNRELLANTAEAITRVEEHHAAKSADPIRLEKLEPLRLVERELDTHEDEGTPFKYRMGMYQGERIYAPVRSLYLQTVRDELVKPILDIELEQLRRFVQRYAPIQDEVTDAEHEEYEARLRFYLLLTGIAKPDGVFEYPPKGEPGIDEKQRPWVVETMSDKWAKPLELAGDVATRTTMLAVAEAYVDIVVQEPKYLFERDVRLVADVRTILNRTDRTDALLAELIRNVEAPDIALSNIVGNIGALKNDNKVVRGAYTRKAWDDTIKDILNQPIDNLLGNEWVLGLTAEQVAKNREEQLDALRSRYFEEYIREWKGFVGSLYTTQPADYTEAIATLRELTGGASPPLARVCQHLAYHTTLEDPVPPEPETDELDKAAELGGKALEKKGGKAGKLAAGAVDDANAKRKAAKRKPKNPLFKTNDDVRKEFAGLVKFGFFDPGPVPEGTPPPPPAAVPLDTYQEELKKVRDALQAKIDSESPEATDALLKAVETGVVAVDGLLTETDTEGWNSMLTKVLKPPFLALRQIAGKSSGADLTKRYCAEVVDPMTAMLQLYPFNKASKKAVTVKRFAEFFTPETGKLWVYYQAALASRIPVKNNDFSLAKTGRASTTNIDPRLVSFLDRAHDVSRSVFPIGSDKPSVEFQVMAVLTPKQASVILTIDGKTHTYITGPEEWQPFTWPGEGEKKGALLRVKYFNLSGEVDRENREWGLFELLEQGTITGGRAPFTQKFDMADQDAGVVTLRINPQDPDANPFFGTAEREVGFLEVFRHPDLTPPKSIVIGGPSCD